MSAEICFLGGPLQGQKRIIQDDEQLTFGRHPECDIVINDNNISRRHAELSYTQGRLSIRNLASRNGIFINGAREDHATLGNWDTVVLGSNLFRVEYASSFRPDGDTVMDENDNSSSSISHVHLPTLAHKDTEWYHRLVNCLLDIQRIINQDHDRIIEDSLETLFSVLPATHLSILYLDNEGVFSQGYTTTPWGPTQAYIGRSFAGKVLEAEDAILINAAGELDENEWGNTIQEQHVHSILGVPIKQDNDIVAVLICDNQEDDNALTDEHLQLMSFASKALEGAFQRNELHKLERRQIHTEQQFLAASRVQGQIFNKDPEPQLGPMQWLTHYTPALELGGDFYDYEYQYNRGFWIIADVSGKGIGAALIVSMLKAFCKTLYPEELSPAPFLRALNLLFQAEMPRSMFFTAAAIEISDTGLMRYASIGHPPGFLIKTTPGKDVLHTLGTTPGMVGPPHAAMLLENLEEHELQLEQGDRLCFYTDGVLDAGNTEDPYGQERLEEALSASAGHSLQQSMAKLSQSIFEYQGTGQQYDDIMIIMGEFWPLQP